MPWIMHSLPATEDGLTMADVWRDENTKRISLGESVLLDAYAVSWLSVWEVADVEPGIGTKLVDLLTREERFVHDVASSKTLHRRDALLAFVLDCDGVSFFGGIHGHSLPPRQADFVVRDARLLCRVRTRPVVPEKLRDTDIQLDIIAAWRVNVERMFNRPPPSLSNTDGDPLVLTTDDFELLAPMRAVADRVASIEGADEGEEAGGEIHFAITKPGNAPHQIMPDTMIAHILIGKKGLRLDTNSARRANAARALVEAHLGNMIRFRLRSEVNTADMMRQARANAASGKRTAPAPQPPELVAIAREYRERHMTAWMDDSIPALNNLTPRESARLKHMRPVLDLLLKDIEHAEARLPAAEQIDVGRIRVELGMTSV